MHRKNFSSPLEVVYRKPLREEKGCWDKYQWDLIHDPESVLFSWLEEESEAETISITDLLTQIREANQGEEQSVEILQDQCPQVCYKDFSLDSEKIKYLQVNCSREFQNSPIDESMTAQLVNFKLTYGDKKLVMPGEKSLVTSETNLGDVVYYQFHEAKVGQAPVAVETTDNFLFEFAVLKEDKDKFEEYLYPKALIEVKNLTFTSQYAPEIDALDCHWCSSYANACCDGDKERIENDKGELVCESGKYKYNDCCNKTARYMIEQYGKNCGSKINLNDFFVTLVNEDDCRDGVTSNLVISDNEVIKKAKVLIKEQTPLLAGVFYEYNTRPDEKKKPGNTSLDGKASATNHFIVIMGYGINKEGKEYFMFYDPASDSNGNNEGNILIFDDQTNLIKGKRIGDTKKSYILTEMRLP